MASDKISLRARALVDRPQIDVADGGKVPVIVRFNSNQGKESFFGHGAKELIHSLRKDFNLIPALAMNIARQEIEKLAKMQEVAEVWYDELVHVTLDT